MSILAIEFSKDDLRDTNVLTQRLQQHFDESARVKLEFVGTHLVGSHPNVRGIVCCIRAWQRRVSHDGMFHFANTIREIYLLKLWKIKYVDIRIAGIAPRHGTDAGRRPGTARADA